MEDPETLLAQALALIDKALEIHGSERYLLIEQALQLRRRAAELEPSAPGAEEAP